MLRFVSYNIHSGRDLFWRRRLLEMGETLQALQPDFIGLQEIHQNSRYGFQATYLAEALQYQLAFSPSLAIADGYYGNALLSRLPLTAIASVPLPARQEKRSLLQASSTYESQSIQIWVTHCSLHQASRERQLTLLRRLAEEYNDAPLLLMGDFNMTWASFAPWLIDCARACGLERKPTLPSIRRRIDYMFASPHWRIANYETIPVRWSDHFPILTDLELAHSTPRE